MAVVTMRTRPPVVVGSCSGGPSSDGWRHGRSCGGSGARSTGPQRSDATGRVRRSRRPAPRGVGWPPRRPGLRCGPCSHPTTGDDWLALTADELPVAAAYDWAVRPDCGAVVLFSGTVRDHAEGRDGVEHLTYEAYDEAVVPRLAAIAAEARQRWPMIGRLALLHRTGRLELGESSVLVVVSTPHRAEAFEAGRYAIDALKASVPIWKHETWRDGSAWGTGATPIAEAGTVV